jgi:DNA-binding MarR family transcriptional regulator
MTAQSKLILDQIALHADMGAPLTIRKMIEFRQIASPATIHKHLASLRMSGYVIATSSGDCNRIKYLTLSSLGQKYINNLSKAIISAAAEKLN